MITKTAAAVAALLLGIGATAPAAYAANTISACGATISASGNYTVTRNLTTASTAPCITITASGVAIDLQGHMITGPGSASTGGAAIADSGSCSPSCQQNIIIANGTIQGFADGGIFLNSTQYVTIAKMNLMQNGPGPALYLGQSSAVVTDSAANNNSGDGMYFVGSNITVNNSPVNNNAGIGMEIEGSNNTVNNSSANKNGFEGIELDGSGNSVSNSPANNNGDLGMRFIAGNNTVSNSPANGNGAHGGMDFLNGSGDNTISDSQANGNKGPGIYITGSGNLLSSDTANGNAAQGISVVCPSNLFGNTAHGNSGVDIATSGTPACTRLDNTPAP